MPPTISAVSNLPVDWAEAGGAASVSVMIPPIGNAPVPYGTPATIVNASVSNEEQHGQHSTPLRGTGGSDPGRRLGAAAGGRLRGRHVRGDRRTCPDRKGGAVPTLAGQGVAAARRAHPLLSRSTARRPGQR